MKMQKSSLMIIRNQLSNRKEEKEKQDQLKTSKNNLFRNNSETLRKYQVLRA